MNSTRRHKPPWNMWKGGSDLSWSPPPPPPPPPLTSSGSHAIFVSKANFGDHLGNDVFSFAVAFSLCSFTLEYTVALLPPLNTAGFFYRSQVTGHVQRSRVKVALTNK